MNFKRVLRFGLDFRQYLMIIKKAKFTIGLLLGILMSLLTGPQVKDCSLNLMLLKKSNSLTFSSQSIFFWFQDIINSNFDPVLKQNFNLTVKSRFISSSIKRPRFFSDELKFKDDLLIVVLTSGKTLSNMSKAINSTLGKFSDKLIFFTENIMESDSNLIQLPSFNNNFYLTNLKSQTFLKMLIYLSTHDDTKSHLNYLKTYKFIFFVSDKTYVQGEKLINLIASFSSSKILFALGSAHNSSKNNSCAKLDVNLEFGVIINDNLWARCHLDIRCWFSFCQNDLYSTYKLNFDQNNKLVVNLNLFKSSMITYPLLTSIVYYNIHYLNTEMNFQKVLYKIKKLEKEMNSFNQFLKSNSWPIFINPPAKPSDRFNVNHWSFINESHVYFPNDFDVVSLINYYDKNDLDQIKAFCSKYLTERFNLNSFDSIKFSNIYKKFDATRGLEYIFGVDIYKKTGHLLKKRVQILKPLNPIELIIKLPYVTENSLLTLFLTITNKNQVESLTFFINQFIDICLKKPESQTSLIVVSIQSPTSSSNQFLTIKSIIFSAQAKYKTSNFKIFLLNVESGKDSKIPNEIGLIDIIGKKYFNVISNSIIMNCKFNCLISLELLNRVRMNTIKGHQIFFPIPFIEYKLRPKNNLQSFNYLTFDVSKSNGRFGSKDFRFYSFYFDDYWKARQLIQDQFPIVNNLNDLKSDIWYDSNFDVLQLFLSYNCHNYKSQLNILRAIEPELKLKYFKHNCEEQESNLNSIKTCNDSFYFFGSSYQMAQLIFDYKKSKNSATNNVT